MTIPQPPDPDLSVDDAWPKDADMGGGTVDEESEWYEELNRGYSQDRI